MRNLAVVEGMDIDALRAGINWEFQSFAEYLATVRRRAPYANLAVLVGHSAVRTAVMGEDASSPQAADAAELAEMKRLVAEAMNQGAIGLGASYSLNHSGWGGVPMPSTISELGEFDALVGAMGPRGPGRRRDLVGSAPGRRDGGDRRTLRPAASFMSTGVGALQRAVPAPRDRDVRGLRRRPGARQRGLHPDHLPAAVVRFHARQAPIRSTATRPSTRSRPIRPSS